MKRKARLRIIADGVDGFFHHAREHARKLDRGELIAPEIIVTFDDATDMLRVLSPERIRLLKAARGKRIPVLGLATGLKRDARAVSRDVDLLESFGLIQTRYEVNPGHGRRRIVEPRAARYQLVASI